MEPYDQLIKHEYETRVGDATALFRTILSAAEEIGLEDALACLERCVTEKRLAWLDQNLEHLEVTGDPVLDGYRTFYERYLGISAPEDGEIVERTAGKMVIRWWNR